MKRSEMEAMTKDEYYNSPQFYLLRMFHNGAHKVLHEAQDLRNVLYLVASEFELGSWVDKYNLVDDQIKLLISESRRLMDRASNLTKAIEPHKWSDWENGPLDLKVDIAVNGKTFSVSRGTYPVSAILALVNETIDGYNLFVEQGKEERMWCYPFDMPVTIAGNEVFHTQVKGGSSN